MEKLIIEQRAKTKSDQECIATDYDISMNYHIIESTALTKALDKLSPKKEAAT
jgi:hypothetical protein